MLNADCSTFCGNDRLPERYPEAVEIADDELSHSIKSVVKSLNDLHSILELRVKIVRRRLRTRRDRLRGGVECLSVHLR